MLLLYDITGIQLSVMLVFTYGMEMISRQEIEIKRILKGKDQTLEVLY